MSLPVRLVTFDVTGTLLLFRTPIFEKYRQVGLKFGIKADGDVLKKNFKYAWQTLNEEHPNFGRETLRWEKWWSRIVERTFTGYVKPEEGAKISGIVDDLISFHATKEAFVKRPGTDELLECLKAKSLKLGVISNYDPRLKEILQLMGLQKYFDFVLLSYEFGYSKPDVRIFQEALKLGCCTSGEEAIHVGDDLMLDYLGAKNSGMRAVLLSSDETEKSFDGRVVRGEVFEEFYKLKNFFEGISKRV